MNNKQQLKETFMQLLLNGKEKIYCYQKWLTEFECQTHVEYENKGKPWRDDELRLLFSQAPTMENAVKFAKVFKRSPGSIIQIYRWAATPNIKISASGRGDNVFIQQIKRIAKEEYWVI